MTEPLNLDPIAARHSAATPGTWHPKPSLGPYFVVSESADYEHGIGDLFFGEGDQADADREFVLNAHDDVAALLAEVRRLRAIEAAARTVVGLWGQQQDRELAYSDSWSGGTEPARLAYQRGATYETCRDDLLHVLEEGTVPPDYVGYDEPAAPAAEGV